MSQYVTDAHKIITENPHLSILLTLGIALFELLYGVSIAVKYGMWLVALLLVADWLSGVAAANKDAIDTSHYGVLGLLRAAVLLMLPAIANALDNLLSTGSIFSYFMILALARNMSKSVIANSHRAGWSRWVPSGVLEMALKWVSAELAHKEKRARERYNKLYKEE